MHLQVKCRWLTLHVNFPPKKNCSTSKETVCANIVKPLTLSPHTSRRSKQMNEVPNKQSGNSIKAGVNSNRLNWNLTNCMCAWCSQRHRKLQSRNKRAYQYKSINKSTHKSQSEKEKENIVRWWQSEVWLWQSKERHFYF